jgi:hypothetical protein
MPSVQHTSIKRGDGAHHVEHAIEILAVQNLAPRGPYAEACRAFIFRVLGRFANVGRTQQLFAHNPRLVVPALRTVRAVLGTAAGLYREQPTELDFVGVVESAVRELRPEYQLGKRKMINAVNFVALPIVADFHPQASSFRGFKNIKIRPREDEKTETGWASPLNGIDPAR